MSLEKRFPLPSEKDWSAMSKAEDKIILDSTRDTLEQMRSMDYLTRTERIMNLKAYQSANADTLDIVLEANELVNKEIQNLERSRLDAMKVYHTELRDDMRDSALYTSEKYAEAARNIESSMSSAFQSMINGGASWRDALKGFMTDIAQSFSKMASDMAARAIMTGVMNWMMPVGGSLTGAPTPGGLGYYNETTGMGWHGGGIVGYDSPSFTRMLPTDVFANAPRLHGGIRSDEYPAILKKFEPVGERGFEEYLQKNGVGQRGSGTTNIYFNITTPNADSFRRSKTQIANDIKKVTR